MSRYIKAFAIAMLLCALAVRGLADPSAAVQAVGSQKAAEHLRTHEGAFTDGLTEYVETFNREGEHIFCTGSRVSMWDSPQKGQKVKSIYPGSLVDYLEKTSEFELVDMVHYRNTYFALVRIYKEGLPVYTGWLNADYIGCSCTSWEDGEPVDEWTEISLTYRL